MFWQHAQWCIWGSDNMAEKNNEEKKPDRLQYCNFRYATSCWHPLSEDRGTIFSRWVIYSCNSFRFLPVLLYFLKKYTNLPIDLLSNGYWKPKYILSASPTRCKENFKLANIFKSWGVVQLPSLNVYGFELTSFVSGNLQRESGTVVSRPCNKVPLHRPAFSSLGYFRLFFSR